MFGLQHRHSNTFASAQYPNIRERMVMMFYSKYIKFHNHTDKPLLIRIYSNHNELVVKKINMNAGPNQAGFSIERENIVQTEADYQEAIVPAGVKKLFGISTTFVFVSVYRNLGERRAVLAYRIQVNSAITWNFYPSRLENVLRYVPNTRYFGPTESINQTRNTDPAAKRVISNVFTTATINYPTTTTINNLLAAAATTTINNNLRGNVTAKIESIQEIPIESRRKKPIGNAKKTPMKSIQEIPIESRRKKRDAESRFDLIRDIEYDFILALRKGKHYLGQATLRFHLGALPKGKQHTSYTNNIASEETQLYINFSVEAIAEVTVNGILIEAKSDQQQ